MSTVNHACKAEVLRRCYQEHRLQASSRAGSLCDSSHSCRDMQMHCPAACRTCMLCSRRVGLIGSAQPYAALLLGMLGQSSTGKVMTCSLPPARASSAGRQLLTGAVHQPHRHDCTAYPMQKLGLLGGPRWKAPTRIDSLGTPGGPPTLGQFVAHQPLTAHSARIPSP